MKKKKVLKYAFSFFTISINYCTEENKKSILVTVEERNVGHVSWTHYKSYFKMFVIHERECWSYLYGITIYSDLDMGT